MTENNDKPILSEKSETKHIRLGVVLSYVRLAILIVVSVFYPPFLVSHIGQELNGLYQFAASIPGWLALLSLGTENAYYRFATMAEEKGGEDELRKVNGFFLIFFGAIGLLVMVIGLGVALMYGNGLFTYEGDAENKTLLANLIIILTATWSVDFAVHIFTNYIFFRSRFAWNQLLRILQRMIIVGGGMLSCVLLSENNVEATMWVAISAFLAQFIVDVGYLLLAVKKLKIRFSFEKGTYFWKMLGQVIVFSVFIFLTIVVNTVNQHFGRTILGSMYSVGAVTIFAYAIQFYDYGDIIVKSITTNFAPRINRFVIQGRDGDIKNMFTKVTSIQMIIMFAVVGGFIACGHTFVYAWLYKTGIDSSQIDALYYMSVALLSIWLIPFCQSIGVEIQRAYNKHKFIALFNVGMALINIVLTILLVKFLPEEIKIYGPIIGMGVAALGGMIIASNVYYKKALDMPIGKFFARFGVMLLITAIATISTMLIYRYAPLPEINKWILTLLKAATFLIFYIPGILIYYRKEMKSLLGIFKKGKDNKETN